MPDKRWETISLPFFYLLLFLGFTALWWSPAVVSICTYASFIIALPALVKSRYFRSSTAVLISLLIIVLLDVFLHLASSPPWDKLGLLAGFILLHTSGELLFQRDFKYKNLFFISLAVIVALVDIASVSHYFIHKTEIDALLLQSKSIPILPEMHHIHFGVINAIFILGLLFFLLNKKYENSIQRLASAMLLIIIYMATHILSSRTGLVALYGGLLAGAVVYAIAYGKSYAVLVVMAVLLTSTALVYSFSTSFHNKVANSIEDINSWGKGEEMNHKSMAMRIEAYRASWQVIKGNPLGVGAAKLDEAMYGGFDAISSPLTRQNQKNPHNQILEFGVKYGWIGMLLITLYFVLVLSLFSNRVVGFSLITLLFISMFFESLLERQASIYFIAVLIPFYSSFFSKDMVKN